MLESPEFGRRKFSQFILKSVLLLPWAIVQCTKQVDAKKLILLTSFDNKVFLEDEVLRIEWLGFTVDLIRIELSLDEEKTWMVIADQIPSELNLIEWKIPNLRSQKCKIRIFSSSNPYEAVSHSNYFTMVAGFRLDLLMYPDLLKFPSTISFSHRLLGPLSIKRESEFNFAIHSMYCTHNGCELKMEQSEYVCPCHGSQFDRNGCVLQGPATKPLTSFQYQFFEESQILKVFDIVIERSC